MVSNLFSYITLCSFIHIFTNLFCYALDFGDERRRFIEKGVIPPTAERYQTASEEIEEANNLAKDVDRYFEGDIELSKNDEGEYQGQKRNLIQHNNKLWTKSNQDDLVYIPFVYEPGNIDIGDDTKKTLQNVFEFFEQRTCIRFKENSPSESPLTIYKGDGCHSTVGKHDDGALLSLGDGCEKSRDIKHELMHVLGFFHEQSRIDRDDHVMVRIDNIQPGKEKFFGKYQNGKILELPYDKKSITHYSSDTFSRSPNVQSIVSLKDSTEQLGGSDLSSLDIEKINRLYDCTNYKDQKASIKKDVVETERFPLIGDDANPKDNLSKIFINTHSTDTPSEIERTVGDLSNKSGDSTKDVSNSTPEKQQFIYSTTSIENIPNVEANHDGTINGNGRSEKPESVINEIISTNNMDKSKVIHDLEGDMDVGADEVNELYDDDNIDVLPDRRILIRNPKRLWKKVDKLVRVPFQFATGRFGIPDGLKRRMVSIFSVFHKRTCIRFEERPDAKDAITIVRDRADGCRSKIGRHKNGGEIKLGKGCRKKPVIKHEVMHALGFLHEHSRPDRNKFVTVFKENIEKGKKKEFKIKKASRRMHIPYDKQSIMHYHRTSFSKDPKNLATIVSKSDPEEELGNASFTQLDIDKVNLFYQCNIKRKKKLKKKLRKEYKYQAKLAATSDSNKEDDDGGGHRFG